MFYLQTNDGERFLTAPQSSDKDEFIKIVESKMGSDATEVLTSLLSEAHDSGMAEAENSTICTDWDEVARQTKNLRNVTSALWSVIEEPNIDKAKIEPYLQKLDSIAYRLENT